jgi:hypothetical protein
VKVQEIVLLTFGQVVVAPSVITAVIRPSAAKVRYLGCTEADCATFGTVVPIRAMVAISFMSASGFIAYLPVRRRLGSKSGAMPPRQPFAIMPEYHYDFNV